MTLNELYNKIGGDYGRAMMVLRIEKLLDKHIRKLPSNPIFAGLEEAGKAMDGTAIFESAHAIKGVASNLGLVKISDLTAEICDEFRPGNARRLSDEELKSLIKEVGELYKTACDGIKEYEASQN